MPAGLVAPFSNSAAADLNLKNTSEGDGESRERIAVARNDGICCALVKLMEVLPRAAVSRSSLVFTVLSVVHVGAVISVTVNRAVGL